MGVIRLCQAGGRYSCCVDGVNGSSAWLRRLQAHVAVSIWLGFAKEGKWGELLLLHALLGWCQLKQCLIWRCVCLICRYVEVV